MWLDDTIFNLVRPYPRGGDAIRLRALSSRDCQSWMEAIDIACRKCKTAEKRAAKTWDLRPQDWNSIHFPTDSDNTYSQFGLPIYAAFIPYCTSFGQWIWFIINKIFWDLVVLLSNDKSMVRCSLDCVTYIHTLSHGDGRLVPDTLHNPLNVPPKP